MKSEGKETAKGQQTKQPATGTEIAAVAVGPEAATVSGGRGPPSSRTPAPAPAPAPPVRHRLEQLEVRPRADSLASLNGRSTTRENVGIPAVESR